MSDTNTAYKYIHLDLDGVATISGTTMKIVELGISIGNCIRDLDLIAQVTNFDELTNLVRYLPL